MSVPFRGRINLDIRDSVPDWTPFEAPKAPEGAPNVVLIVLDDVGFSAMSNYGGPIPTPNIDRIADSGVRFTQWHTTALCSPTRAALLTGRNHTRNSMACITEAATGLPNASGTIPQENGMLSQILNEQGWNTYIGDAKTVAPDKPFFLYYAPGAAHAPHQAPREWIDKFAGKFDQGYEKVREETLDRQKVLGIVPEDTELPPVNPIGTPQTRTGPQ